MVKCWLFTPLESLRFGFHSNVLAPFNNCYVSACRGRETDVGGSRVDMEASI